MENNTTPLKIGLRYGLIVGLILIIYDIIMLIADLSMNDYVRYISYTILLVFIVLAHNAYKKEGNGYMTIGQGLGTGVILTIVQGFLTSLVSMIYISFIDPSILEKLREKAIENIEASGSSDAEIEQAIKMSDLFLSPIGIFIVGFISSLFVGFIISLIVSLFTKKDNPQTAI